MPELESLGIKKIESIHYYVHDLDKSRRLYCDMMDFAEIGESTPELTKSGKQRSILYRAGDCNVICSAPVGEGGRASRFLKKHPDGIGTLAFEVLDVKKTFKLLDERGGTPIQEIETFSDKGGTLSTFSITTPFGDTTFRFVERHGFSTLFPGLAEYETPRGGKNVFGIEQFDHVTTNFQTMKPALLWLEHVLGFEKHAHHHPDVVDGLFPVADLGHLLVTRRHGSPPAESWKSPRPRRVPTRTQSRCRHGCRRSAGCGRVGRG